MAIIPDIEVDIRDFVRDAKRLARHNYPMAVAKGFRALGFKGREAAQDRSRVAFKLHSDYIPRGILSVPYSAAQVRKGAKSIRKYHDILAMVFVRSSTSPKRSLDFLTLHEEGGIKRSQDGSGLVATPGSDISNYNYRTSRGRVSKRWRPSGKLLEEYFKKGPNKRGSKIHGRKKGKQKPAAFLLKVRNDSVMVARRLTGKRRPLEFLYAMKKTTVIKKTFHMEDTVQAVVRRDYRRILNRALEMGLNVGPDSR